jgi:hypothetical protein
MGLAASVELEASETRSPGCGVVGNHENDAAGGACEAGARGAADGRTTVNVLVGLKPTFPA